MTSSTKVFQDDQYKKERNEKREVTLCNVSYRRIAHKDQSISCCLDQRCSRWRQRHPKPFLHTTNCGSWSNWFPDERSFRTVLPSLCNLWVAFGQEPLTWNPCLVAVSVFSSSQTERRDHKKDSKEESQSKNFKRNKNQSSWINRTVLLYTRRNIRDKKTKTTKPRLTETNASLSVCTHITDEVRDDCLVKLNGCWTRNIRVRRRHSENHEWRKSREEETCQSTDENKRQMSKLRQHCLLFAFLELHFTSFAVKEIKLVITERLFVDIGEDTTSHSLKKKQGK